MKLKLTESGIEYLLRSMEGGPSPQFCKISIGNGADAGHQATELSNTVKELEIGSMIREDGVVTLYTKLNNSEIFERFRETEMGVFITDPNESSGTGVILFAYGYVPEEEAAVIPAAEDYTFETIQKVMVYVGETAGVTAILSESMFSVPYDDFLKHAGDKENPHDVAAEQLGIYVDEFCKKIAVYTATPDTLAEVIASAEAGATVHMETGDYPLLTFTGEYGLARAETDNPLQGTILKYPENLTIIGGEGVAVAGISITSGANRDEQYSATDTLVNKLPGGLTLKNLNLSDSICLRNCTIDGLNILDCHFAAGANIQIDPNSYKDKFGEDDSQSTHTDNAGTFVNNLVIKGNTIDDASTSKNDKSTSAIRIHSVNNVEIGGNVINKAAFNGVQINSKSGSNSTGKIGISSNTIKNTGSRSIRISNLRNAKVFVCSNNLYDANLVETGNEEIIKVSSCYNTTYAWAPTGNGSTNSYRKDGKVVISKLTVGNGITLEDDINTEWTEAKKAEVIAEAVAAMFEAIPVYNGEVV